MYTDNKIIREEIKMKHEVLHTDNAPAALGPYSQAIKAGNLLFLSGQVPLIQQLWKLLKVE